MSDFSTQASAPPQAGQPSEITVGTTVVATQSGKAAEVFTMTLGGETITLLPQRNWSQLDLYKWRARGKVPGTPAGLEITFDHIKVASEVVSTKDPEGKAKLQKLLNEWLAFAKGTAELAQQKARPQPTPVELAASARPENILPLFRVELDKQGQVHINCFQGKETLAMIGLNLLGLNSLINQGLMRKPRSLQVGALHDWVELDGELFSFEKGHNDASKLEKALNDRYRSAAALSQGKEVVVFANAASPTGFDIQFAAKVGGIPDHHRRPLNEESLTLLQTPDRCDVLPTDLVIKLSPPNLIFKRKTPDGGERYLDEGPETVVRVTGDEGEVKFIDLSQPVNYLRLTAMDLTAVFNHPTINQRGGVFSRPSGVSEHPGPAPITAPPAAERTIPPSVTVSPSGFEAKPVEIPGPKPERSRPQQPLGPVILKPDGGGPAAQPARVLRPLPNSWLEAILSRAPVPHEWFTHLVYSRLAEHFGNSSEGMFGPIPCWACSLGNVDDVCDPAFRGVFLTQKGGLAYLNQGHIARFHNEVAFVGTLESAIEGIGVSLRAVGADSHPRIVFIVTESYRTQFGLPIQIVAQELARLKEHGALVMSANEVLHSPEPVEVLWTVPAEQQNPDDPQAVAHLRPGSAVATRPAEGDGTARGED
ncbi:MAG: hypothetical protein ACLQU3_23140 [Limisphaerales bacterium]